MKFNSALIQGRLIKRYKRFLADVELEDGSQITAHCPNTGAMTHCAEPNSTALLRYDPNPKRKLAYTWEAAINKQGEWIGINTHNANKLVEECLLNSNLILNIGDATLKREYPLKSKTSRLDFALLDKEQNPIHFIEVKSVTLCEDSIGYFPDTVSTRATKHCNELAALAVQGYPCSLVFCVQHSGIKQVRPARHIDPNYADALSQAISSGVNIIVVSTNFSNEKFHINQTLNFNM
ncbi:DNA/RNA nuclease SfsA [Alteromonas sp. 5E99-2]|uniref:DNA/RNA nuclease SfsA n=1 Tax=Alteromonas sp. 5E99-2 TaxID=2817683 RepID=UPI001A99D15B|nr:DNA/RNA nuclease SfsA [Alteromonas sp. 5E99-2]MBO1256963.1 DNA/RNA nuclease SfsA [Alteromonas sp. 5E99-2]